MKNVLPLIALLLLTGCKMQLDDNFFEIEVDSNLSQSVESNTDPYGFNTSPIVEGFYIGDKFIYVYYRKAPARSFHIEEIETESDNIHYKLSEGSAFNRNYIHIFDNGNIASGGADLGYNWYHISNATTLASPPDAKNVSYQQIEDYRKNGEVRGQVKSSITKSYSLVSKFGEDVLELEHQSVYKYDPIGNLINYSRFSYDKDSDKMQLLWEESFEYDNSRLIRNERKEVKSYSTSVDRTTYKYNDLGLLVGAVEAHHSKYSDSEYKWTHTSEYTYADDSILTMISFFGEKGQLSGKSVFTKEPDGSTIETRYDSDGKESWRSHYDSNGNLISGRKEYGATRKELMRTSVIYPFDNIVINRSNPYSPDAYRVEMRDIKSLYDKSCNLLTEEIKWQEVKRNKTYNAEEHKTYFYIYDNNGNWIKRKIESKMDDPDGAFWKSSITIEERSIEYY